MKKYDDDIPAGSPSQEKRDLKPRDALLRSHGFSIKGRPKTGGSVWVREGKVFTELEAVTVAFREKMEAEKS